MTYDEMLKRLKAVIDQQNVSVSDLSDYMGLSKCAVYKYLNGERNLRIEQFTSLADYLGIDACWLITGENRGDEDVAVSATMDRLVENIIKWGKDRKIDNPITQMAKVTEEVGEIAHEISRDRLHSTEIQDAIGDAIVATTILADTCGFDIRDCVQSAYQEIRNRKGHTVNGGFVKEQ